MNILGISAFYHDLACCLLQNDVFIAAGSEERGGSGPFWCGSTERNPSGFLMYLLKIN